jgi:ubiquinone/menaquinone biosynthesis C-methylase UbiE
MIPTENGYNIPVTYDTGWRESAEAWIEFLPKDRNRKYVLDPAMLSRAGDVRGLTVLDLGCGEGRFSRMLTERGATVFGIDPTPELIDEAEARGGATYEVGFAENLPYEDDCFDLVISYLVWIDVADVRPCIAEAARVLKPGGRLLVANLLPMVTTPGSGWEKDGSGSLSHYRLDRYREETATPQSWYGINVLNWHRPMETYMKAYISSGLHLTHYEEPLGDREVIAQEIPSLLRVPFFDVQEWTKPS